MTARPDLDIETIPDFDLGSLRDPPQAPRPRLGELLRAAQPLDDEEITRIKLHQVREGLRFGEAAVALGLARPVDVDWALSQQYRYAWARGGRELDHPALVMACDPFSAQAEAFRDLRAQLMADERLNRRPLAVVGAGAGVGRSHCAANLAIAFSQLGARTLLIDADLRSPQQHRHFGVQRALGLSELLANRGATSMIQRVADLPDLHLLLAGSVPPNPLELLQGQNFRRLLASVAGSFDHVVIDTPAAERGADARVIAAAAGAAVLVGRRHHSPLKAMQKLVEGMTRAGVLVAGVVMAEH